APSITPKAPHMTSRCSPSVRLGRTPSAAARVVIRGTGSRPDLTQSIWLFAVDDTVNCEEPSISLDLPDQAASGSRRTGRRFHPARPDSEPQAGEDLESPPTTVCPKGAAELSNADGR